MVICQSVYDYESGQFSKLVRRKLSMCIVKSSHLLSVEQQFCQAQPQLQPQPWLKAEIALFSSSPATQPPTHPLAESTVRPWGSYILSH